MRITEIRVSLRDDEKLKAFVSVTFDHCFALRGLKVIKGNRGYFVAMPSRRRPDGSFQDLAHPVNNETRKWMEEQILKAYLDASEGGTAGAPVPALLPDGPRYLHGAAFRPLGGGAAAAG